jgi:hypothetical protein
VAQAVVRAQAQAPAGARGQVVPGLVGVLAVVVAPVEDLVEAVELALAAAGRELVAAVAEAPVRVAALEAQELAVADPVVAEEKQHLASG